MTEFGTDRDGNEDGTGTETGNGNPDTTEATAPAEPTEQEPTSSASDDAPLEASVVTVASDRSLASDAAGTAVETALEEAGHDLTTREHVAPDHDRVQSIVLRMIERGDVDLVITAGATSVEPDDVVIEAVEPLLDKELTTFRELFTSLGYEAVGTRVLAARTLAGVADGKLVFCLPGNADAARLGTEEIILPEARHLVDLARDEADDVDENDEGDADESGEGDAADNNSD